VTRSTPILKCDHDDNLIEIRDLNVAFHGQPAVRNLCLDIRPANAWRWSKSGSGKSVTAHSILQLLPESDAQTTAAFAIAARNCSVPIRRCCANCAATASR
jgi:ABC-type microcin C transport system duplicated ATPase subunit YejF